MSNLKNYWRIENINLDFPSLAAAKNYIYSTFKPSQIEKPEGPKEIIHFQGSQPLAFVTVQLSCTGIITFSRAIKF